MSTFVTAVRGAPLPFAESPCVGAPAVCDWTPARTTRRRRPPETTSSTLPSPSLSLLPSSSSSSFTQARATRRHASPRRRATNTASRVSMSLLSRRDFMALSTSSLAYATLKRPYTERANGYGGNNGGDSATPPPPPSGASTGAATPAASSPSSSSSSRRPMLEAIFDTTIGSFLPAMPSRLLRHRVGRLFDRVVLVGEHHTNALHHKVQLRVIRALHELNDGVPLAVGLEHFYRQHQAWLDRYVRGEISLERLLTATQAGDGMFGYDASLWQPIMEYARAHRIRLIGLNVPFELVQLVAQLGLDGLPSKVHEVLPRDMDTSDARHRERFIRSMKAMGAAAHGNLDDAALNRMYEAQLLWDEYMSESASRHLQQAGSGRLCVLAGTAHVEGRTGLPNRITRRTGMRSFTIVPQTVRFSSDNFPDIERPAGKDAADWLWYVPEGAASGAAVGSSPSRATSKMRYTVAAENV